MTRISSRKYLAGSRGETCKLRIPGVCTNETDTVIPAHIRDRHTGRSIKASDLSVTDACFACHEVFDGRNGTLPREDWLFYALRGLQDTLEAREAKGLLFVPKDPERLSSERQVSPRKPPSERKPVPYNPDRKIQSRNNLRKRETI